MIGTFLHQKADKICVDEINVHIPLFNCLPTMEKHRRNLKEEIKNETEV